MGRYKYLFWDIDGTVIDFKAAEKAAIKALFVKFGLGDCPDEKVAKYSAINDRYWKALEKGEMTKPQILVERFREFFESEGIDPSLAEAFNADYQVALGDTVVFCDDAYDILLEQKGTYELIAITNGTEIAQRKKLSGSGLDKVFDGIYISEIIGTEKPNKGFFEAVLNSLKIENTSEILIIGDSLTSDILGGINMGIDTCWYNPGGKENDSEIRPTYVIRNLHEIENIVG